MRKRIIPIVVIAVLAVAGYFVWRNAQTSAGANGALSGSGTVETEQIAVTPQTSGRIVSAPSEEGVRVKKGDVLYRLDASTLQLQVKSAEAGVRAASANYSEVKKDDNSTWADKQAAKAQLDQANVALNLARVQAGYADIHSPIDGSIASIAAHVGENASPGSTLAMISDPTSLTVTIYVSETEIGRVKVGQKGSVTTDSTGDKKYSASVVFVGSQAEFTPASIETKDQRTKLVFQVKLSVKDADAQLKPGMPADVVLEQ